MFNDAAFTITAADKLEPSSPITVSVPMSSDNNYDQLCSASKPSFHSLRIQPSILAHRLKGHLVKMSFGIFNTVGSDIRRPKSLISANSHTQRTASFPCIERAVTLHGQSLATSGAP